VPVVLSVTMRALLTIIIAAAALCAAGCAATASEPTDDDKATIGAISASKQRINALSERIDANQLETEADVDAYVRDMRSAAAEFDTLRGALGRVTLPEAHDELAAYGKQLGTTAKRARELATAVEDRDEKAAGRAETAYAKAGSGLSSLAVAVDDALTEDQ
jgi:hypothetical protein